jgi:16S rRNA pseudouridine516 synthase
MRIDKFLSNLKYGSRKQIKDFLVHHQIRVNQEVIKNIDHEINHLIDEVFIDGIKVFYQDEINLMIYKPKGYLSATKDNYHLVITSLLKEPYNRFDYGIAGRLDLDSEGLLILSTNGKLIHEIMHPKSHINKVYEVILDKKFINQEELFKGVYIKDKDNELFLAKAIELEVNDHYVKITIDEGKFHQVKRMFKSLNYEVLNLKRIQIGNLKLNHLQPGEYIEFRKEELYD